MRFQNNSKVSINRIIVHFLIIKTILITGVVFRSDSVMAYSNTSTHPGITEQTVIRDNDLLSFLQKIGLLSGEIRYFKLTLDPNYQYDSTLIEDRDNFRRNFNNWLFTPECGEFGTGTMASRAGIGTSPTNTLLDWFRLGSVLADAPIVRASDHFHDPTKQNNQGLNNSGNIEAMLLTSIVNKFGGCNGDVVLGGVFYVRKSRDILPISRRIK